MRLSDWITDAAECRDRTLSWGPLTLWWPFPICAMLHSSAAVVFGCPVYGGKKRRWIRVAYRGFTAVSNAKYWVKYRIFQTRYHWVDTEMRPGSHDPSEVLLYAAMACLKRYIEEMGGLDRIDQFNAELRDKQNYDENAASFFDLESGAHENSQADRQDEAAVIWRWWAIERPRDKARRDELLHILYGPKDRVSFKPADNPAVHEMVFKPFEGDEVELHREFRALDQKIDDDEQAYLLRLIEVRQSLWT